MFSKPPILPIHRTNSARHGGFQEVQYAQDRDQSLRNRKRLAVNANLREWYRRLYNHQFQNFLGDFAEKRVLEIGSGASPLKSLFPQVLTSDVIALDHIDLVFDCHSIDRIEAISDCSVDIISLTNVLHHLRQPVVFLTKAATKLVSGGVLIATEPYFSVVSTPIYQFLHHEPVKWRVKAPVIEELSGPLSSANMALPYLLFFTRRSWARPLWARYRPEKMSLRFFSCLSYMLTGGMTCILPVPHSIYRLIFNLDLAISQAVPRLAASFFTVTLVKK